MIKRLLSPRALAAKGYTLVELLMAMVIIVIVFLAIVAAETSSIQGYISARDSVQASELGRRVIDLLHIEGGHWDTRAEQPFTPSTYPFATGSGPFDQTPRPLIAMVSDPWNWKILFSQPVSVNLANSANVGANTGGRFCAYARGGNLGVVDGPRAIQVQIAIVYSGPKQRLTNCATDVDITNLDLSADSFPGETIILSGYRTKYFGTVVTPN